MTVYSCPACTRAVQTDQENCLHCGHLLSSALGLVAATSAHALPLSEEERQVVLIALGHLAAERRGWDDMLNRIALRIDNAVEGRAEAYDNFRSMHLASIRLNERAFQELRNLQAIVNRDGGQGSVEDAIAEVHRVCAKLEELERDLTPVERKPK
jgi:hypothetical protein